MKAQPQRIAKRLPKPSEATRSDSKLGVHIWGCRGSIASPSKTTSRFGGNTSCYEVLYDGTESILIDAGTGIYPFGLNLQSHKKRRPVGKVHVFLSHLHWDHIQGLTMCPLMHDDSAEIIFYSYYDNVSELLEMQFRYAFFPVVWREIRAKVRFHHLSPGEGVRIGPLDIKTIELKHPGGSMGFSFTQGPKTFSLLTDHEIELMNPIERNKMVDFLSTSQLVLIDGMYMSVEKGSYMGWGHSAVDGLVNMFNRFFPTKKCHIVATHHYPFRSDEDLLRTEQKCRKKTKFKFDLAREGKSYFC